MKTPIIQHVLAFLFLTLLTTPLQAQETIPAPVAPPAAADTPVTASAAPAPAPANPEPMGDYTKYFAKRDAAGLTYFRFTPEILPTDGSRLPLVVVLHDANGTAAAARFLITPKLRQAFPAYIVVPALPENRRWADPGPLKPVHAVPAMAEIIKQTLTDNPVIDPARIYIIGCGTGGNGVYGATRHYADIFAAAMPISATWNPNDRENMHKVPTAAFHGAQDKIVPDGPSNDTITMIKSDGGTAYFTKFEGLGHDCSSHILFTPEILGWLFKQKK